MSREYTIIKTMAMPTQVGRIAANIFSQYAMNVMGSYILFLSSVTSDGAGSITSSNDGPTKNGMEYREVVLAPGITTRWKGDG